MNQVTGTYSETSTGKLYYYDGTDWYNQCMDKVKPSNKVYKYEPINGELVCVLNEKGITLAVYDDKVKYEGKIESIVFLLYLNYVNG